MKGIGNGLQVRVPYSCSAEAAEMGGWRRQCGASKEQSTNVQGVRMCKAGACCLWELAG